jgi:hypothetical protein
MTDDIAELAEFKELASIVIARPPCHEYGNDADALRQAASDERDLDALGSGTEAPAAIRRKSMTDRPVQDLFGVIAQARIATREPGVFDISLAVSDALALSVAVELRLTATPEELRVQGHKRDGGELDLRWAPAEPESRALAYEVALANPAKEALNLLRISL